MEVVGTPENRSEGGGKDEGVYPTIAGTDPTCVRWPMGMYGVLTGLVRALLETGP